MSGEGLYYSEVPDKKGWYVFFRFTEDGQINQEDAIYTDDTQLVSEMSRSEDLTYTFLTKEQLKQMLGKKRT